MQFLKTKMFSINNIIIIFYLISKYSFVEAKTVESIIKEVVESKSKNLIKKTHAKQKNEITSAFSGRKVCMNVCNPPYYNQEYPTTYRGYYNSEGWNQNYIPGGYNNFGDFSQNLFPSYDSGYESSYYPQGDFGDFISGCYRNMFRKKYKSDPGNIKPTIYNYKTITRKNAGSFRRSRNYNNQDLMNCQLICYPVMVPSYMPSSSLLPTTAENNSESDGTTEENSESISTTKKTGKKTTSNNGKKSKRHKGHQ